MRTFFRSFWNALTAPWVLALVLTLFCVFAVWLAGPYVAIADHKILESIVARLIATLVLVFLWGLFVAIFYSRRKKKELANPEKAAVAEQTAQARTAFRDERDYIRDKIKNAIRIVTHSNFYSEGKHSRYTLPWFLVIGPENCGKTSFLLNSGLQFPLNEQADRHLYQLKATTRCETMFANQAVFVDTPGSYSESRRETPQGNLWQLLLKRLFHTRPAKPANGVIVCISIREIMDSDIGRREHLARTIRERLSEILQTLRTHVPVFLVFTKCDVVPGFAQFFAQLPRAEREQMFGCPVGNGINNNIDMGKLREETAEMLQTLNAQIISKIHQERNVAARGDIFRFPQELATLSPNIEDFIAEAFGSSRYHRPVMFRGFFFTSALSSQDVFKSAARGGELAFQTGFQPSQGDYAKGFFILRLLQECIIPEASLAGADKKNLWAIRLRRHGLQVAATAIFIFLATFLGISFMNNYLNIEALSNLHSAFAEKRSATPSPPNAKAVLPELDVIEKTLHVFNPAEDSNISYGLGLYQGNKMDKAAHAAYLGELNDRLVPQARQIAAQKIEQSLGNIGELKPALRAYLMLCEPKRLKRDFISDWLGRQWSTSFMGDAQTQASLGRHMDYAMTHGIRPVKPDQALLDKARQALLKVPLAELAYQQMKEEAQESGKPPFTFRASLGESMSPFDGDTYPIPYLYTRKGYEEYCVERCPSIIRSMTDDSWIFGASPLTLSSLDIDRIYKDVRAMYFRDYTKFWTEGVRKLTVPVPKNLSVAANTAERLTAGVSPVTLILREVRDNTNLIIAEAEPVTGAVAEEAQKKAARKIGGALGSKVGKAVTQSAVDKMAAARAKARAEAQKDARAVRQYFLPLVSLIDHDGNPAPALKAAHDAMANACTYLTKLHSSDDPAHRVFTALLEIADGKDETLRDLENAAGKLPSPVRGWYESVPTGSLRRMLFLAAGYINQAYRQRVVHVYERDLSPYYPFNNKTDNDVSLDAFSSFFRAGGTLDSFYDAYLRPFTNNNGTLRSIMGQTLPLSSQALAQLTRANRVQSAFFSSGRELGINFTMEPYALDANKKQVTFSIDNDAVSYWHGIVQGRNFSWPGNHGKASLEMTDLNGISNRSETRGDWAVFRILQKGAIKKQENNTCLVEMRQNGGWAQFLIQFRNKLNPFDPAVCSFTLPPTLQ